MPDQPSSEGTITWREVRDEAEPRLAAAGFESPEIDVRRIIERATSTTGAEYQLTLDELVTERGMGFFDLMLTRRLAGEPLQYVVGRWGFRSLDLFVDHRVLIPRPETEVVVEVALAELDRLTGRGSRNSPAGSPAAGPPVVVDLGTGSGAIALSVAVERPAAEVWAIDRSPDAVAVARANLSGLGSAATRVRVLEGSWFEPLPVELAGRVNLVISNPPYVAPTDPLPPEVADWEPREALIPGPTGFEAIEVIVSAALVWLAPGGALVVEMAPDQVSRAVELALATGYATAEGRDDLAGRARMLVARAPA